MTTYLPFASNTLQVYAYEKFNFTILDSSGATLSNTSGLSPSSLYFSQDTSGNTVFSVANDVSSTLVASTRSELFTLTKPSSVSSNSVTINPGRFLDSNGLTLSNRSFEFYKNETIPRIRLVAPSFTLRTPTSLPSLPPGLSYVKVASNIFDISGTPSVVVPNSNYLIIGVDASGSKVVTTNFSMAVSNERVRVNVAPDLSINNMIVGSAITPRTITAIPPVGTASNGIRYTFPTLPDGINVTDNSGNIKTSPFVPTDPSYTLRITGTPNSNAARAFANDGATSNGFLYPFVISRVNPAPLIETTCNVQFAFQPTVLFDDRTTPFTFYIGVPVDSSSNFFRAQTYFTSNVNISNMFALSLPTGLSLEYVGSGRANIVGDPSGSPTSSNYTIRAIDSNGNQGDYRVTINVSNDAISFSTPTVDACYSFILSRPVDQIKTGYYESSNIRFAATAASGRPVTLSAPALSGTGLSLDSNGVLVGIPTTLRGLTTLNVIADTGFTTTTNSKVKFSIVDDVFTFANVADLSFIQNIAITPFQFPVTTLSGRNVIGYSSTGLPSGLSINPVGILSGTPNVGSPTSGNVRITATTGFASGSRDFSYNLTPDSILFTTDQDVYTYVAGESDVLIPITGTSYSGTPVRNYLTNLDPSFGIVMTSNIFNGALRGELLGTWTDSIPPNKVLPASRNFTVSAQAGTITGVLDVSLTASPALQNTSFVLHSNAIWTYNDVSWNKNTTTGSLDNPFQIVIKNNTVDGNFILATAGNRILRFLNANDSSSIVFPSDNRFSSLTFDIQNWWVSGKEGIGANTRVMVRRSEDNGLTWSDPVLAITSTGDYIYPRESNSYSSNNAYLLGGAAIAQYSNIVVVGGLSNVGASSMMRAVFPLDMSEIAYDLPPTWTIIPTGFVTETAYINTDVSNKWVATGSGLYATKDAVSTSNPSYFTSSTTTIKYSTDQGATWIDATTGAFNMFGYELVYASNTWVATGVTSSNPGGGNRFFPELRYSTDAINWTKIDLSTNPLFSDLSANISSLVAPMPLGSMNYDGSKWNVFVQRNSGSGPVTEIYSSPTLTGTWAASNVTSQFQSSNSTDRFLSYTRSQWLRPSSVKTITITLDFKTGIGNGPQILSPETSLLLYQYVPVSIQVLADDPNALFFIADDELPPGLEFNPSTGLITGKPAQPGTYTTRIYAKNSAGVTLKTIRYTVIVPRVIRKQDGAGAYTSLLKQYTEVLAAQSGRDNRVLPTSGLGEFMSPVPATVTTAYFPYCGCPIIPVIPECPDGIRVDAVDASTNVCAFIDGNTDVSGNVIDVGNAEPNVCQ